MEDSRTQGTRVRRASRGVVLVAILTMFFLLAVSGVAFADVWSDISDATWLNVYHVTAADALSVAEGFPDGTFRPYQSVTRGQFAKMVVSGLDIPLHSPPSPTFSDVPATYIFYGQIESAFHVGVIAGFPGGTFRPGNNISRQQTNSIVGLWLSGEEIDAIGGIQGAGGFYENLADWFASEGEDVLSGFGDHALVSPVHRPGTAYLAMRGVVLGSPSGGTTLLNPLDELSRAQAVTMIIRTRDVELLADTPTVTNVDPEVGPAAGGNSVVITGTGFGGLSGASAVKFGTHNATSYVVNSITQITAVAPPGVAGTTVDVRVTNTGGQSAIVPADEYTYRTLHLSVTGIADPVTAGATSTVTVSVLDQDDVDVTDYTGTVHFTSDDTAAVLPANYTFKLSDEGTHTFTGGVVLKAAGERTVTATDTVTPSIHGSQTVTVNHAAAAKVRIETLANGTGTTIDATGVVAGNSFTAYAITRDTYDNFVENVAAAWSLIDPVPLTGGVVGGDLVAAGNGKSATFTGHLEGAAKIHAVASGSLTDDTGIITVTKGAAGKVSLETLANGTGVTIDATSVAADTSLTVYAISRDAGGNFIANVAADVGGWTLSNITGGVAAGDLVPAVNRKSAVFTGLLVGTCKINAASAGLTPGVTGTITVTAGAATKVRIETLANGTGTTIDATTVAAGNGFTAYAISRDAHDNFVGNPSATWSLTGSTGGVADTDLAPGTGPSSVFTGHLVGTGVIHAVVGAFTDDTGTITVTFGAAAKLAFGVQPTGALVDASITPDITVRVEDANGNLVTNDNATVVTLAIATNPPGTGTLAGTLGRTAVAGVATFDDVSIDTAGVDYTLGATSVPALTTDTSNAFTIT